MCSIIMTHRCVYNIGRHVSIFYKRNNEYAIVCRQRYNDFWAVFPLNIKRSGSSEDSQEDEESRNVALVLRDAQAAGTPRNDDVDIEPALLINNYVGGSIGTNSNVVCQFKAERVESLKEYIARKGGMISYSTACLLIVSLHSQYEALLSKRKMIPFYSLKDIIVVDDKFVYANPSKLLSFRQFRAVVNVPYNRHCRDSFYPPEIWNKCTIPYNITPYATLFSMAYMIIVCLFGDLPINYDDGESQWAKRLDQIYSTKLYWCLLRCLYTTPEKRKFIII